MDKYLDRSIVAVFPNSTTHAMNVLSIIPIGMSFHYVTNNKCLLPSFAIYLGSRVHFVGTYLLTDL